MRVWIGHWYTNNKEWFVGWADYKQDVWEAVNADGESTREFSSPGLINFNIKYDEQGNPTFSPSTSDHRTEKLVNSRIGRLQRRSLRIHKTTQVTRRIER